MLGGDGEDGGPIEGGDPRLRILQRDLNAEHAVTGGDIKHSDGASANETGDDSGEGHHQRGHASRQIHPNRVFVFVRPLTTQNALARADHLRDLTGRM